MSLRIWKQRRAAELVGKVYLSVVEYYDSKEDYEERPPGFGL